jgi:hypothetical protein
MSTDYDVPVGSDPQDEFPGHCSFCGEQCARCEAYAAEGGVPTD